MLKLIDGLPVVKRERDAYAVYDTVACEVVAYAPGALWSLSKSKWMRENGTGNKCVYVGWPS